MFNEVSLYYLGGQGIVLAGMEPCPAKPESIASLRDRKEMAAIFEAGTPLDSLESGRVLLPRDIDRMMESVLAHGVPPDQLVSTDDNMYLEYATPKGNVSRTKPEETVQELQNLARKGSERTPERADVSSHPEPSKRALSPRVSWRGRARRRLAVLHRHASASGSEGCGA